MSRKTEPRKLSGLSDGEYRHVLQEAAERNELFPKPQDDVPDLMNDPDFVFEGLRTGLAADLHAAMKRSGLNESQLARKLGVSRQAVNEVLAIKGNMKLRTLAKFCVALGLHPEIVFLGPGEKLRIDQPETTEAPFPRSEAPAANGASRKTRSRTPGAKASRQKKPAAQGRRRAARTSG